MSPTPNRTSAASTRSNAPSPPASGRHRGGSVYCGAVSPAATQLFSSSSATGPPPSPSAVRHATCTRPSRSDAEAPGAGVRPLALSAALSFISGRRSSSPSVRSTRRAPRDAQTRPGAPAPAPSSRTAAPAAAWGWARSQPASASAAGQTAAPPMTMRVRRVSPHECISWADSSAAAAARQAASAPVDALGPLDTAGAGVGRGSASLVAVSSRAPPQALGWSIPCNASRSSSTSPAATKAPIMARRDPAHGQPRTA
eukprot:scaffold13614_cov101-Isochrysis_galbana.AAC.3